MQPELQPPMMVNTPENGLAGNEIDLRAYWDVLLKRRRIVLAVFFTVVVVVVLVATLAMTPIYQASTQLLVEQNEHNGITTEYGIRGLDPQFLPTQFEIIKSKNVSRRVVRILQLDIRYRSHYLQAKDNFSLVASVKEWWRETAAAWMNSEQEREKSTVLEDKESWSDAEKISQLLTRQLSVKPVRNTSVVNISYQHDNPVLAKLVVNAVARAYMDELLEIRMRNSNYTVGWMNTKADEERGKLQKAEQALQRYMAEHDVVTVENKVAINPQQLTDFSSKLSQAQAKRSELEDLVAKIQSRMQNPAALENLQVFSDTKALDSIRDKILQHEQQLSELSKKFGPKHPAMVKAREEQALLRQEKVRELQRLAEGKINEYELAKKQEENLTQLLQGAKSSALTLNEKMIQYNLLKREVETNRILYDALLKQIKERSATEQTQAVNVSVLEEAVTPTSPAKPKKRLNLMLAMVLGLFGGVALAFFVEYLDNTVKSGEELEERYGLPLLGQVPYHKLKGATVTQSVARDNQSLLTDSYRMVRAALMLSAAGRSPKTILITSVSAGEGKSSTSLNLARTFVQADKSVLLIDADMRKPRLHSLLELENSFGLSTYLAGVNNTPPLVNVSQEFMQVMTAGPTPPNPAELLDSDRMKSLLETLAQNYDLVLIDAPPILNMTDALVLSKIVDGTLLVVRSGHTTRETLANGLAKFRRINSNFLGVVLNGVRKGRRSKADDGYGYGYGYGSGYGYYAEGGNGKESSRS
ncbi:MAG: hypothetical protein BWK76_10325 [Desulfobulbaceae bacterium A2]|nr:MAG: hypothetical protein BWK76_10325 [Desulfobulbaceae bacterium A2]